MLNLPITCAIEIPNKEQLVGGYLFLTSAFGPTPALCSALAGSGWSKPPDSPTVPTNLVFASSNKDTEEEIIHAVCLRQLKYQW